jgi:hypothetical protein
LIKAGRIRKIPASRYQRKAEGKVRILILVCGGFAEGETLLHQGLLSVFLSLALGFAPLHPTYRVFDQDIEFSRQAGFGFGVSGASSS